MLKEYKKETADLLLLLLEMQEGCAPIELSIGYTDQRGSVKKGILLREAPPVVIEKLIANDYCCSLTSAGILVYKL